MKTTGQPLRCLIVEDMEDDAKLVLRELRAHGYEVTAERVDTAELMRAALDRAPWDLVISDYSMPRFSGLDALKLLQACGHDLPFILVSGAMGEVTAVNAMRVGAHDYLLKHDLARLGPAVQRELAHAAERRARRSAESAAHRSEALLAVAGQMVSFGGWSVNLTEKTVNWSDQVALIHDELPGFSPALAQGINYYAPEWRDKITEVFTACARDGTPYDEEMEIITARGRRVWVRTSGQAVRDAAGCIRHVQGAFQDISKRKHAELIDQFLAQAGNRLDGESFFPALARFLAKALQMDYICIDRLEGDALNATTLAVWHDGHFEDNITYALKDTPCGEVVSKKVCCYPAHVSQNFPNDAALQQLQAESYVGVTLFSHTGHPIGLIAVIGRQPLANRSFAESTLARVAPRAAGELERIMVEAKVQQSEERYRLITENASDLIWLYNLKTAHFDYISPSVERLLGYTREEVQAAGLTTVLTPASAALARTTLGRRIAALAGGDRSEIQHRGCYEHVRKDGSIMIGEVTSTALLDQAGQPSKILGVVRDITEAKRLQQELQLSESRFRVLFEDISTVAIQGYRADGITQFWNRASERFYGYTAGEAVGRNLRDLIIPPEMKAGVAEAMRQMAEKGTPIPSGELSLLRKDGTQIAVYSNHAIVQPPGRAAELFCMDVDLTSLKRAEHTLKLQTEELRQHNEALTRFNEAAVGRELRMVELKREINELCERVGEPPRHRIPAIEESPR